MAQEIKIEKKASDVVQPVSEEEARQAIRAKKDLSGANLRGMKLDNLNAVGAILRKTDLAASDLSHGLLLNPNFYRASLHGAAVHNTLIIGGDLVKTSFQEANLGDSLLLSVDAQNASFEGASLRDAALVSANLENANFTKANLSNTRLASLNVTGADFTDADLTGARAYHVDWTAAKVPPTFLPEPLVQIPRWAWSVLIGGFLGTIGVLIYGMTRKKRKVSS